jgi:hypothetical protein
MYKLFFYWFGYNVKVIAINVKATKIRSNAPLLVPIPKLFTVK